MKLTSKLLARAARAASVQAALADQITAAFEKRYGVTHSDVDADELIDALDYGRTEGPTLARCDAIMAAAGYPVKEVTK